MQIHTFRAESLQAALQQVRRQLGPDAAILQTREKRQGRLGIFAKPLIEVEATLGPADAESVSEPPSVRQAPVDQPSRIQPSAVDRQSTTHQQPTPRQITAQQVAASLNVSGAIELAADKPHVVALVGPTGSGKTTSLAKIAASFRFDVGCRVGLVGLDTFRLGAVDQLLQFADMLSASLEVVSSAEHISAALQRLSKCDIVLIDTAGRAPRDAVHLADLRKFLELARPHSTQLVVSASSSLAHVRQTVECFASLKPTDLLITKVDEAVDFGSWSTLLQGISLPISYLTHGQRVPQDIVPATAARLASLLSEQPLNFQQSDSIVHVDARQGLEAAQGELQLSN